MRSSSKMFREINCILIHRKNVAFFVKIILRSCISALNSTLWSTVWKNQKFPTTHISYISVKTISGVLEDQKLSYNSFHVKSTMHKKSNISISWKIVFLDSTWSTITDSQCEKMKNLLSPQKKISSNQLFSTFFGKTLLFKKIFSKKSNSISVILTLWLLSR